MYKKGSKGWLKHFDFILLDMICLQIAFLLAYVIRHDSGSPYIVPLYRNMAIFMELLDIVVMFFYETLSNVLKRGYFREFAATVKHVLLVELFSVLYLFTMQEGQADSRTALYLTGVIYAILTYIVRIILKKILRSRMSEGNRSLLVVTTKDMAEQVVHNIRENNYERFALSGLVIIDDDLCGTKIAGVPVVADEENAAAYVCREWIDEVFVIPATDVPYPYALMEQFTEAGVTVHLNLAKVSEAMGGKKQLVEKVGPYTVLTTSINYASTKQLFMKRAIDIAGGLFGCLLTLLITLFVGPAIYLKSPGPIFFAQERVGKNGKKFKMYKFRSMYMDAEERKAELMKQNRVSDGMMFKLDFDPRVIGNEILPDGTKKTGIGNFIRVTSLDEFPQFFNVLKGDMSIVGTRPPTLDEWNKYELHHRARLAIKPGITGMWQVSGRSEITDFEEVVKLDTEYISEWNVEFFIFHELRHLHQHYEIALSDSNNTVHEDISTIVSWKNGFINYTRNEGGSTQAVNLSQEVEIDANAYALCLSNMLHISDNIELRFSVPQEAMDLADPRSRQYYENRPELKRYIDKLKRDAGQPVVRKPERNELCPCGSGKKFKKCCIGKGIYD